MNTNYDSAALQMSRTISRTINGKPVTFIFSSKVALEEAEFLQKHRREILDLQGLPAPTEEQTLRARDLNAKLAEIRDRIWVKAA